MSEDHLTLNDVEKEQVLTEISEQADRILLMALWAHLPIAWLVVPMGYGTHSQGLVFSLIINLIATIGYVTGRGKLWLRLLNSCLIIAYSILFITIQFGRIEMHFHVFASLPILIMYRDWRVILPGATLISLHHAAFNYCQSAGVEIMGFPLIAFNYGNGWDIVFLHASFVIVQSVILIFYSKSLQAEKFKLVAFNKGLEDMVNRRTVTLVRQKERIENYKTSLDQVLMNCTLDLEGNFENSNRTFINGLGYKRELLLTMNLMDIISDLDEAKKIQNIISELEKGKNWKGQIVFKDYFGEKVYTHTAFTPMKIAGKYSKIMMFTQDVTESIMNEKLIDEQKVLITKQSKLSTIGEMAAGIAHEINNPLAIISATMKVIKIYVKKGKVGDEEFNDLLKEVDNTILRITKIINSMRNVTRDTSVEVTEPCSIDTVLNDVLPICSPKFKKNDIAFSIEDPTDLLNKKYMLKRIQLAQVFLNLLSNAVDEISEQEQKWIKVRLEEIGGSVRIKVFDSGAGVPRDVLPQIFQPFYTTKGVGKGTGLGLSLSKTIVDQHNGNLFVDTEEQNTCFVIELPISSKVA